MIGFTKPNNEKLSLGLVFGFSISFWERKQTKYIRDSHQHRYGLWIPGNHHNISTKRIQLAITVCGVYKDDDRINDCCAICEWWCCQVCGEVLSGRNKMYPPIYLLSYALNFIWEIFQFFSIGFPHLKRLMFASNTFAKCIREVIIQ